MSDEAIPQEDYMYVAAIDFGTTFSGYAFAMRHNFLKDKANIHTTNWIAPSGGITSLKTPTTLLLNPDKSFNSFGYDAEAAYTSLSEDDKHENYFYFRRFKMSLFDRDKRLTRETKLKDMVGKKELPALEIFTHSIRYLKDHLLKRLENSGMKTLPGDIMWVLTVPAIWDDPAKQFMREAAEKADILGGQLKIALEPEAASVFCQVLPIEKLEGADSVGLRCFSPGSRYLVLDAGGGTVDITVHEVQRNGSLKELDCASGGAWGGIYVDQMFKEMLEDIVGKGVLEGFALANTSDYIALFHQFEAKKRNIPNDPSEKVTIKIPQTLIEMFEDDETGAFHRAIMESRYKDSLTLVKDKVRISNECFRSFFKEAADSIVDHVRNLLNSPKVKGTKNILMVGGFSESLLLQRTVRDAFPDCRVIIPQEAGLCVLKGAVIFGYRPKTIIGRVAKCTYGIASTTTFQHGKHRKEKLFMAEGKERCKDIFNKHVTLGDELKMDDVQSESEYFPIYKNQKSISLPVVTSCDLDPSYTDEKGCKKLGPLNLTFKNPEKGSEGVKCSMIFGETELKVKAEEKSSGQTVEAKFDFLSLE
ncbi:hypothetical protein FSP39_017450 [Pinctada imbricata]|uniref:Heat shock 70 kDa protein 12B n=1 Tax=Pinctada imbricata TaxID=66713 RepID=A0AA89BZN1_PINIB|nr:hypothetical protein FSP39_017450 [Pinctada imbricata]